LTALYEQLSGRDFREYFSSSLHSPRSRKVLRGSSCKEKVDEIRDFYPFRNPIDHQSEDLSAKQITLAITRHDRGIDQQFK